MREATRFSVYCCCGLLVALAVTACIGEGAATGASITLAAINTPTQAAQQPTLTPTVSMTATPVLRSVPFDLVVWWPEPLMPPSSAENVDLLARQIDAFAESEGGIQVEFRLKKAQDVGGIMSTLRTASLVAPGALPDLTLLRRDDLVLAVQSGLLQSLEGRASSAVIGDLYNAALRLGQVGGDLYGLAYVLEVQQLVYRPARVTLSSWRFDDVLEAGVPLVFPAGRASGINDTFFLQYLAAGGTPLDGEAVSLNVDALRETLYFYERAVKDGLLDTAVLQYTSSADYQARVQDGTVNLAIMNSTRYLLLKSQGLDLRAGPIPTQSGQLTTVLDGWMWVLTTSNVDRQARALRFLSWMMDGNRQYLYSQTTHMLPSQRTVLRRWDSDDVNLYSGLLNNAVLPQSPGAGGTLARAMQNALVAVISGDRTADEATNDVVTLTAGQ